MAIKSYLIQGSAKWAKILGKAPAGYENGPAEWSFDLILDAKAQEDYKKSGGDAFYLKENSEGETFLRFTRKEVKQDGSKAKPIKVIAADGSEWDDTRLIGNGSVLNVSYTLNEVKSKGTKRFKPSVLAVQVWDLVPFKGKGFPTKTVTFVETPEAEEEFPF